jgi:GT2 family glycosyltransferase
VLVLNNDTWDFRGFDKLETAITMNIGRYGMFFGMQLPERFYAPCPSWFSGFVMTRWCFDRVGPFDAKYWPCGWEDDDYMMRLAELSVPTAFVRDFTFRHRSSPSSEIRDADEKKENDARNQARFTERWGLRRLDKESPDFKFPGMTEI